MSSESMVGRMVADRYRLERLVGRGGMADVFVAADTKLDRVVAVKLLHVSLAEQPSFRTRFRQEAHAAARMNHPNIVRVYDAGEASFPDHETPQPFLVMEYVEGTLLKDLISDGPVDQAEAIRVTEQILSALEYSHRQGIVHRDVKPGNIIIASDGRVKVADFGIARAIFDDSQSLAQTTTILGTAAYFSPEQARGEVVDARSDVYSAGVVLFEMLTGIPPFRGESPVAVAYLHISEAPVAPSSLNPQVSPAVDVVVARALTKNKSERYSSAEEFREDLETAGRGIVPIKREPSGLDLLFGEADSRDLSPSELALKQLTEGANDSRVMRRPPVMWLWTGGTAIIAMVVAVLFWAVNLTPNDSLPSTLREIPNIEGLSERKAEAALDDIGLTAEVTRQVSENVRAGYVVTSDPAPGEIVSVGTKVRVFVSTGKKAIEIPSLQNQSLESAKQILTDLGLKPGTENRINSPSIAADQVISTSPAAGEKVSPGTTVSIILSNGQVTVPDVKGKPLAEATATLQGQDIGVTVIPDGDTTCKLVTGTPVIAQSDVGDVPQRSEIKLRFCAGG